MPDLFFEDFNPGSSLPEASLTVTPEDAAYFAATFGPGATEAGDEAHIPLSGWHVAALGMRLLFEAFVGRTASLGAPGIEAATWPYPVWPGDRLRFAAEVIAARISASRPEMGLVTVAIRIFNQNGACVMTQDNAIMVARRDRSALHRSGGRPTRTETRA